MAELPDDVIEAFAGFWFERGYEARWDLADETVQRDWIDRARVLLRFVQPLIAARVRAEAIAERDAHWRQRLADLQAEYARIEVARERRVAEAVADERQKLADAILPHHWQTMQLWGGVPRLACGRSRPDRRPSMADRPICEAPCPYGGRSMARKYSRSELGVWNHCNRPVREVGQRCWQHREAQP